MCDRTQTLLVIFVVLMLCAPGCVEPPTARAPTPPTPDMGAGPGGDMGCDPALGPCAPPKKLRAAFAGVDHSCGIPHSHYPICWGRGSLERADPPSHKLELLALGARHGCGLALEDKRNHTKNQVVCWGQPPAPPTEIFGALSAGHEHTCGIGADLRCWGRGMEGQTNTPEAPVKPMTASPYGGCGDANGQILCWGELDGLGAKFEPLEDVEQLTAGSNHLCVLFSDGEVICRSLREDLEHHDPPPGLPPLESLHAGDRHTCGLAEGGEVFCWGEDRFGQLRAPDRRLAQLSAGARHNCGVALPLTDGLGELVCWGDGSMGQLRVTLESVEDVTLGPEHTCALYASGGIRCEGPVALRRAPEGRFTQLDAGARHTCAIRRGGQIVCWGDPSRQAPPDRPAQQVRVGEGLACALHEDGELSCWALEQGLAPNPPADLGPVEVFDVGRGQACAIESDGGALRCWGDGLVAEFAPEGSGWRAVAVAQTFACALDAQGSALCWGDTPDEAPPEAGGFESIAVGQGHACVRRGGAVTCWGQRDQGQTDVPDERALAVRASGTRSCVVDLDGVPRFF